MKTQVVLLLAGILMVPQITAASGNDTVGVGSPPGANSSTGPWHDLGMPAIPYIETMHWIQGFNFPTDTIWGLKMDTVGPFLVQFDIPGAKFSSKMLELHIWTE